MSGLGHLMEFGSNGESQLNGRAGLFSSNGSHGNQNSSLASSNLVGSSKNMGSMNGGGTGWGSVNSSKLGSKKSLVKNLSRALSSGKVQDESIIDDWVPSISSLSFSSASS
eukprot:2271345-Rhodomonas_salina.1